MLSIIAYGAKSCRWSPPRAPSCLPPPTNNAATLRATSRSFIYFNSFTIGRESQHQIRKWCSGDRHAKPCVGTEQLCPTAPRGDPNPLPHCCAALTLELQHNLRTAQNNEETSHVANAARTPHSEVRIVPPTGGETEAEGFYDCPGPGAWCCARPTWGRMRLRALPHIPPHVPG